MFTSKAFVRLFIAIVLLCSAFVVDAGSSGCTAVGTRKEIRQMSNDEVDAFVNALDKFKSTRLYDNLVVTHSGYYRFGHNSSAFLPWNRYYLRQFEQNLQLIDPSVTLPYWDWSLDSQAPERSPIFRLFGGSGYGQHNSCVKDGVFANWQVLNPSFTCLKRGFDGGDKISAFPPPEVISYITQASRNYDQLREFIEYGIHGQVLQTMKGDLGTIFGPNDPLYWLIHGFIDKVWWEWQSGNVHQLFDYGGTNNQGGHVAHCDLIVPWAVPVSAVLDTLSPGLCYVYSPGISSKISIPEQFSHYGSNLYGQTPGPLDRQDGSLLRKPQNLSKRWIDQYALHAQQVQNVEKTLHSLIDTVNAKGHQSMVALSRRPLLEKFLGEYNAGESYIADLRLPDSSPLNNFCPVAAQS